MAKPKRKQGHVRVTCPQCGKNVSVQRPHRFQTAMPCPNCRIPISATIIAAADTATKQPSPEQSDAAPEGGHGQV